MSQVRYNGLGVMVQYEKRIVDRYSYCNNMGDAL